MRFCSKIILRRAQDASIDKLRMPRLLFFLRIGHTHAYLIRLFQTVIVISLFCSIFGVLPLKAEPKQTGSSVRITNRKVWELKGEREPFTAIFINGRQVVARGPDRKWSVVLPLEEGENKFQLVARDISGNDSPPTIFTVIRDSIPPLPPEFDPFPLQTTETAVTFSGTIEPGCSLFLRGESLGSHNSGLFELTESLGFGDNNFEFSVRDDAGNQSPTQNLRVTRLRKMTQASYAELKPPKPEFTFPWWGWVIAGTLVGGAAGTYYAVSENEENEGQEEDRRDVTTIILVPPRLYIPSR
jgi:hypothetical protein